VSQHSNYTKFILIAFGIKDDGINRQDKIFAASKLQIYLTLSRGKWVDFIARDIIFSDKTMHDIHYTKQLTLQIDLIEQLYDLLERMQKRSQYALDIAD
jgi:hypothetical protein